MKKQNSFLAVVVMTYNLTNCGKSDTVVWKKYLKRRLKTELMYAKSIIGGVILRKLNKYDSRRNECVQNKEMENSKH